MPRFVLPVEIHALRKFLADFLIDISWASSLLEGSTYSSLDTQALIEYGARVASVLGRIVECAGALAPVQSALYLMTRIPCLQAFANGNKRTARLAANIPLLNGGHLPISFVDFAKADYIGAMAAFYELGNLQLMERAFVTGYVRSIIRGSDFPATARVGLDLDALGHDLVEYVLSGRGPKTAPARLMFRDSNPIAMADHTD